ncbi:AI-2E family transporter [Lysinimonas soli]|uniref:AI-2E family transporter n=1 Tax=Lysinimonas soli TaxID=1074233 RepID=A0ABW0NLP4_9MICO
MAIRSGDESSESLTPGIRIAADWSWRILVVAGVLALIGFLFVQLRLIAIPFLIALLLAALLVPFSQWLQRRHRWPKWAAVAVSEVGLLVVIGGLLTLVVIFIVRGYPALQAQTVARYADLKAFLLDSPLGLTESDINGYLGQFVTAIQRDGSGLLNGALSVGSTAGHVLAGFLITLFSTLFLLIDGRGIWHWVVRLFPVRARAALIGAGEAGWITLTSFVKVQIFVAFVDAVGIGLGAFVLGLFTGGFPLVIPIAIAVFLGSFIPVVGAVLTGVIAVFVALVYLGPIPAVIMLGIVILVQQLEGHVLQPFVMGNAVKVHPLAVVLAVATGGLVGGIPGALFAVPLVAVLNVMVGYIARGDWRSNPHPSVSDVVPSTKGRRGARSHAPS